MKLIFFVGSTCETLVLQQIPKGYDELHELHEEFLRKMDCATITD